MVTLKYRLVGSVNNAEFTKEFSNRELAMSWAKAQGNIIILEIESSGSAVLNRVFGF